MSRWKGNSEMDSKEVWCKDVDWIHLAQHGVQWRSDKEPSGHIKGGEFLG